MVGHYLGLDVHDTPGVSKSHPLEPRVVITIEPGLYLPETDAAIPIQYRGVGLRLEDDVLITDTGAEVLTRDCPRKPCDIERLFLK